jgi:lipopolysaccharide transport system permease protein
VAFKARWTAGDSAEEGKVAFAIVLFTGMIVHGLFSECLVRAPSLVLSHASFVTKVVFPLEVLPWMVLLSSLLHFLVSLGVLLLFCVVSGQDIHAGTLLLPLALLPLLLLTFGLTCLLASLGVFFRDLTQIMGVVSSIALFLAPVFYPLNSLPAEFRALLEWNPITLPVIQMRNLILWGKPFQWDAWASSMVVSVIVCYAGYWWFQKTRRGFADVL